ncbi:S41 family peptidase [Saccharothrix sp. ST-888]|uniref:S41 family peptidase n=1 Tax=Saccharothrix sp. ST-888 TaxID=1427391 RepID=UPI0005EC2C88|nr:S41 family peptidase [Saccharothrix sp. ST-888]KJK59933.1 peptidase S41 [Saccharothrix sp. ST-888]
MTTNAETADILDSALARITAGYVFPERTAAIDTAIRGHLAAGSYEGLAAPELCAAVTAHLQEACPDKHLRLLHQEEPQSVEEEPEELAQANFEAMSLAANFGVQRVERLDGNIGYLDLRLIAEPGPAARTYAAAMEILAHTEALVIDLRQNRGGSPAGVALWCSYFFPDGDTHLNDIYDRTTDSTRQYWTSTHLPAPRYLDRPVYVLTSGSTFSGGEELAYNLLVNERATLIGETTRGGAHPTARIAVSPHITVAVPTARSINPVTGTNWEAVGVVPDIAVPADQALDVALREALSQVAG